jgi:hypothetical protein
MTSQTFRLTAPGLVRRPDRRPLRPPIGRLVGRRDSDAKGDPEEGTSMLRLVGVALLGWFGLMTVVAIVAIY